MSINRLAMLSRRSQSLVLVLSLLLTPFALYAGATTQSTSESDAQSPSIQHWTTDNGARVYYVAAPELPMVDIHVVFDAGSARDQGHGGLAAMTNGLLDEGAGSLDANGIAERFENVGARFGTSSHRDMAIVELRSLTESAMLQTAMDTMSLVLSQPTFPKDSLERERKRALLALQAEKESPDDISDKAFYAGIYGDHPYATPRLGDEESMQKLSREDIQQFHKRYYVASNAVIAIVGAVTRQEAETLAQQVIGKLPAGKEAPPLPAVTSLSASRLEQIGFPSQQTHILIGQPGIKRGDPDYFPLYVGNHILGGGGLVSRLSEEIREKRGLSYSTYSYFSPMRMAGPYILGLQTRNDQTAEAHRLMQKVLSEFVAHGPTAEELDAARKNITGGFPLRIASNSKIASYIAMIGFYGLPLDYLDRFNERVEAVTLEQIRDAFQRRVAPDKMLTVIVGGGNLTASADEPAS